MPDLSHLYQANFKKEDFLAGPRVLTIRSVEEEKMPPNAKGIVETKARIRFLEDERGLICSKTRYFDCTALAGSPNTDKWAGLKVEVFFDPTVKNPNGQRGGIAVRKPE